MFSGAAWCLKLTFLGLSDMHPKEKQIILKYVKEITAENEKSRDEMREVKKNSQLVYDKLIKLQVLLKKEVTAVLLIFFFCIPA